ncbi:MAG: hypothetical protein JWO22_2152 [Frankiales bacterium]|nr:hypothetical protein [Frankiales bacterium]
MTQATVRTWDAAGGSAYLDDGSVVALPPEALEGSAFRFLRPGQRVQVVSTEPVRVDLPRA